MVQLSYNPLATILLLTQILMYSTFSPTATSADPKSPADLAIYAPVEFRLHYNLTNWSLFCRSITCKCLHVLPMWEPSTYNLFDLIEDERREYSFTVQMLSGKLCPCALESHFYKCFRKPVSLCKVSELWLRVMKIFLQVPIHISMTLLPEPKFSYCWWCILLF